MKSTGNKLKVGIYLRLSNEDRDNKTSESIKNQRNMLIIYINKHSKFTKMDKIFYIKNY